LTRFKEKGTETWVQVSSAFAVSNTLLLTAGHCFEGDKRIFYITQKVIYDKESLRTIFPEGKIMVELILSGKNAVADYAILEVRKVQAKPYEIPPLIPIPIGLPLPSHDEEKVNSYFGFPFSEFSAIEEEFYKVAIADWSGVLLYCIDHLTSDRGYLVGGSGGPYVSKRGKAIAIGVENAGSTPGVLLQCRQEKNQLEEKFKDLLSQEKGKIEKENLKVQKKLNVFEDSEEEKAWIRSQLIQINEEMENMTGYADKRPLALIIAKCTKLCSFLRSRGIDTPQIDKTHRF
jgi:hypothetical protein